MINGSLVPAQDRNSVNSKSIVVLGACRSAGHIGAPLGVDHPALQTESEIHRQHMRDMRESERSGVRIGREVLSSIDLITTTSTGDSE